MFEVKTSHLRKSWKLLDLAVRMLNISIVQLITQSNAAGVGVMKQLFMNNMNMTINALT